MKGNQASGLFKYKYLNLILFFVVLFAAFMNYRTWSHSNGSANVLAPKGETRLENPSKTESIADNEEPGSFQSYSIIAGKNIFSPERKDFLSPGSNHKEQSKPAARPQVVLSGVIIFDDYQAAVVSNSGRPLEKGERETVTLKPGDRIGEYKLAKIEADRLLLEASGDSFEVFLYDPKRAKARVVAKTGIQPINEARTTQPAPAVDTAKVEVPEESLEPTRQEAIASASPWESKDVNPYEVRWRKAMRIFLMDSNQENARIVESTMGNGDGSSGLGETKPQ